MSLGITLVKTLRRLLDIVLISLVLVVLATLGVARVIPALTHSPTFVVAGSSMEPTIHIGSVVVTQPVATADLQAGEVVSLRVGPQHVVFTHRITRVVTRDDGSVWVQTKGDANPSADPSVVPASDVLGTVGTSIPYLGYVVQLLGTTQGIIFMISLGLVTLVGAWLLEGVEYDRAVARSRAAAGPAGVTDGLADRGQAA